MAPIPGPPPPDWDLFTGVATEFNNAQSDASNYGYDSTNQAIKNSNGVDNYLCVGASAVTSGQIAWFYTTVANANGCVCCQIPSATFNIIKAGTLDTSTGEITYSGHKYQLQLYKGSSATTASVYAYQVS